MPRRPSVTTRPNQQEARRESDFYPTPSWAVRTLIPFLVRERDRFPIVGNVVATTPNLGSVLDPAAGAGAFERVLGPYSTFWHNIDIVDSGIDRLTVQDFRAVTPSVGTVTTICSNPPFSLIEDFIWQGLRWEPRHLIYLARLNLLESAERAAKLWVEHPPDKVIVFPNRPSFLLHGRTDAQAYAWFVWSQPAWRWSGPQIEWCAITPLGERQKRTA